MTAPSARSGLKKRLGWLRAEDLNIEQFIQVIKSTIEKTKVRTRIGAHLLHLSSSADVHNSLPFSQRLSWRVGFAKVSDNCWPVLVSP